MRNLTPVWVGSIAILGISSVILWSQLRSERQVTSDLRARVAQEEASYPEPALVQLPQTTSPPAVNVQTTEPKAAVDAPKPESPPPFGISIRPTTNAVPLDIYQQSEITASTRVYAWANRLAAAGQSLSPAQVGALNAAAVAELRRETEESVALDRNAKPADAYTEAQTKLALIDRQHATNLRILDSVAPDLTAQQLAGLRTQFDSWYAGAQASARVELDRAAAGTP